MPNDLVSRIAFQSPGLIGKLPAHGDFIARGLSVDLRKKLDAWMSEWLDLARARLSDGFDEAYLAAAPWLWEGEAVHAVLMPSVDSVGRYFPLLALVGSDRPTQAVYDNLVAAIEEQRRFDSVLADLVRIDAQQERQPLPSGKWFLPEGAKQTLACPDEAEGWLEVREVFG